MIYYEEVKMLIERHSFQQLKTVCDSLKMTVPDFAKAAIAETLHRVMEEAKKPEVKDGK